MADNWQLKAVLSANAESMLKALKGVNAATKETRKYLSDVATSAGKLSGKLGLPFAALSAAVGGLSIMSVKSAVVGFTEMGEAVQKGALKAGMSVEQYQRMKYVAEQSGTSIEAMEGSLSKLNRQVGEAAAGKNKNLAGLMQRLGVNMRDSNGQVRAGIDLLPQLADAFQRNENPAVRARMGMALFGKSYAEILPLLAEGSEGIADNLKRFDRIKGVLGPTEIRAAKDLGDSFKDLELVMKGFQGTVAKELVPVIRPLVDGLVAWWVANKKPVSVEVSKMAKELAEYIKTIDFKAVAQGAGDFFRSLGSLVEMVGGAKNALIGLVLFMNLQTLMALGGLISSALKAGWAFTVMAAQAYVAGNASLLSMMRAGIVAVATAGPIGVLGAAFSWMAGAATAAGGLISGAMGAVTLAIRGVGAALMANPLGVIIGLATAAYLIYKNWDTLKGWFSGFFDWIGDKFQWAVDLAKQVGSFVGLAPTGASPSGSSAPIGGGARPSLVSPQSNGRVDGQVTVKFDGMPPGTRVEQTGSGNMPINLDAGYRSYAVGMPM